MDTKIESIIYKVLEQRATTTEREALASWIKISAENEAEFESFRILWGNDIPESDEPQLEFDTGRRKLMDTIHSMEIKKRRITRVRTAVSIAMFLLTILISVWNLVHELTGPAVAMRFENASITTVEQFLTKNWNVKFSFDNRELKDCRFTGYLITRSGDEDSLRSVLTAMNLSYRIEPSGDFLISGNCGN